MSDNPWDSPDLDRRIGRFRVARKAEQTLGFDLVHKIQNACVYRFMESDWHRDSYTVYAFSPQFDPVPEGSMVPWYDLVIEREDEYNVNFRFDRVENQEEFEAIRA